MTTDTFEPTLSPVELDACWEMLRLGDTPLTLTLPSPGRSHSERARILAEVRTELAGRGLGDRRGPGPELTGQLRLLAAPEYQLDLRLGGDPYGDVVGIGAVAGDRAVTVFRRGERVRLRSVRPARMADHLLAAIGPVSPGTGRQVNIPAEVYDAAHAATSDGSLWTMADELTSRGVARIDASSWARMCTGVRAFGQLGTAVPRDGVARFGPWVIGFHITDEGHFLQLRRPDPNGAGATVTVCPLDSARLRRLAEELLEMS